MVTRQDEFGGPSFSNLSAIGFASIAIHTLMAESAMAAGKPSLDYIPSSSAVVDGEKDEYSVVVVDVSTQNDVSATEEPSSPATPTRQDEEMAMEGQEECDYGKKKKRASHRAFFRKAMVMANVLPRMKSIRLNRHGEIVITKSDLEMAAHFLPDEEEKRLPEENSARRRELKKGLFQSRKAPVAKEGEEEEEKQEEHDDDDDVSDDSQRSFASAEDHLSPGCFPDTDAQNSIHPRPLNIVMLVVGTRGDVQPFIAIGQRLKTYGHRVRLATHASFRKFVIGNGLEFYPLGGDPKVLAEYMVRNRSFMPSGAAQARQMRKEMKEIVKSTYAACVEPDKDDPNASQESFDCDAIIANPPSVGHVHVAESLQKPLHMVFTMPWSPTTKWPHPLAKIPRYFSSTGIENRISYSIVDSAIWLGVAGIVNKFRKKTLRLQSMHGLEGPNFSGLNIPFSYIWSPSLAPKPTDWFGNIDVAGFCFLDLESGYKPPSDLVKFLSEGAAPIFVGFGSLPLEKPDEVTGKVIEALTSEKCRGIIQRGWGGLGNTDKLPDSMFIVDNCPHDWLFPQCAGVIHHGGAGTTAAGLRVGLPTTIIPFFGDQPFWGECVHAQGVGPPPIPIEKLTVESLVSAIQTMKLQITKDKAAELGKRIRMEDGVQRTVDFFHRKFHNNTAVPRHRSWSSKLPNLHVPSLPSLSMPSLPSLPMPSMPNLQMRSLQLPSLPSRPHFRRRNRENTPLITQSAEPADAVPADAVPAK